jgi:hypothetical protein
MTAKEIAGKIIGERGLNGGGRAGPERGQAAWEWRSGTSGQMGWSRIWHRRNLGNMGSRRLIWTREAWCDFVTEMASANLYSTNPWFSTDVAIRYRGGLHFAWVCECFDSRSAAAGSAAALIAPSSNPCRIYRNLYEEYKGQEEHSPMIRDYRKTFVRLAREWLADGSLTKDQHDEIVAAVRAKTWTIWRPVLYVIPRNPIEIAGRLVMVPRRDRAGYGSEMQIKDLQPHEFDVIELDIL